MATPGLDITGFHLPVKRYKRGKVILEGIDNDRIQYKMDLIEKFFPEEAKQISQLLPDESTLKKFIGQYRKKAKLYQPTSFELEAISLALSIIYGLPDYELIQQHYTSDLIREKNNFEESWIKLGAMIDRVRESLRSKIALHEIITWHLSNHKTAQGLIIHDLVRLSPKFLGTELVQEWIVWAQSQLRLKTLGEQESNTIESLLKKLGTTLIPNKNAKPRKRKNFLIFIAISSIENLLEQLKGIAIKQEDCSKEIQYWISYLCSLLPNQTNHPVEINRQKVEEALNDIDHFNVEDILHNILSDTVSESFSITNLSKIKHFINSVMPFVEKSELLFVVGLFQESLWNRDLPLLTDILNPKIQSMIEDQKPLVLPKASPFN